jgi:hypothetical protein
VIEDHDTVRSAEQIAFDLGKALQFSVSDLPLFRRGILPASRCQPLFEDILRPLFMSAAFTLGPLFAVAIWVSFARHSSVSDGLLTVFSTFFQVKDFAEEHGWFKTVLYAAGALTLLGFGVYHATRIPLDIFGDIMIKRVRMGEGRVTAREQEKPGKRDDVIEYLFEMKERTFQVSRATFRALDSGGLYRVYYLPRSCRLVAMEPAVLAKEAEEREKRSGASTVAV